MRAPYASVVGTELQVGDLAVDLDGRTIAEVGEAAGVVPRTLAGVYEDGCGLDESHLLQVDPTAAAATSAKIGADPDAGLRVQDAARQSFPMRSLLLIALGSALGGVARNGMSAWLSARAGEFFPWGTLEIGRAHV